MSDARPSTRARRRLAAAGAAVAGVVTYDLVQRRHAILRNFPIVGHFRYVLEAFGPELRQYIVTNNDEERPFSRDQRAWVYTSSKGRRNTFGFGSDNEMEAAGGYLIVKQAAIPLAKDTPAGATTTNRIQSDARATPQADAERAQALTASATANQVSA